MMAMRPIPRGPAIAAFALALSSVVAARSLWSAVFYPALPMPSTMSAGELAVHDARRGKLVPANYSSAVDHDPFNADRRRPATRFRFPGEASPTAPAAPRPEPAAARLIGTVVRADGGGFAVCQIGSEAPHIVRIGEMLGTLTLARVEPGRAIFTAANGSRVEILAPKAGTAP